jgi:hypothetical protein
MGIRQRLGHLPHQVQTGVEVELLPSSQEEEVEPLRARIMLEDERRTTFVFGELLDAEDPGVDHPVEELELPLRGAASLHPRQIGRLQRHRVDVDPPPGLREARVHGLPVLIDVGLQDQALECVVRDTPPSLRGSDPCLIYGTLDSL